MTDKELIKLVHQQLEVMKLALEALEEAWYHVGTFQPTEKAIDLYDKARAVLQEALAEQPAQQEPVAWYRDEDGIRMYYESKVWNDATPLYTSPPQRTWVGLTHEEHMKLKWQQAPVKTQWGDDMVVASVAIDNDHTLSLYCERDQTSKVDAMFAQRTWVNATTWRGLTEEHIDDLAEWYGLDFAVYHPFARAIEAALRSKNT